MPNSPPEPSDQVEPESPEADEEQYVPAVMRLRKSAGPWIKQQLAPEHATRRRWWWNRLFVQVDESFFFEGGTEESIYESLKPSSDRASDVLAEARQVFDDEQARGENVQQRATSLQGAVAIAGAFVLTGAGLLLNTNTLPHNGWRVAIAIPYAYTVFCLVATGLRALRATVRTHAFNWPDPEGPVKRAAQNSAESQLRRAAEFLHSFSLNQPKIDYQLAQMRAAGHWFAGALVGLLITGVLVCAALLSQANKSQGPKPATTVLHRSGTAQPPHPTRPARPVHPTGPPAVPVPPTQSAPTTTG